MKRDRRNRVLLTFIVLCLICSCWGCGDAPEEVLADYSAQESTGNDGNSSDNSGAAAEGIDADSVGTDSAEGQEAGSDTDEENGNDDPEPEENGISGNALEPETAGNDTGELRREAVKVKGIYVSGPVAGTARMDELIELVDQTELNAMVIDIKNDDGKVTYDMQSDQVLEIEAGIGYIPDIAALVSKCKEKDIYLIARIVAFRDPYLAEKKPEWAVHTKDGGIFRDKSGLAWVNPYRKEVWDYLVEIAGEAAEAGFDEVQFDYIRFSTDIKTEEADYGPEAEQAGKIDIITEFTEYLYEHLRPLGVYVAADVFGTVIENEIDQEIVGQDYVKMAEHLDYICPMIYPSHYRNGSYGIAVPDADPYRTIYGACTASVKELGVLPEQNRAHVRAWLQCFTASWVPGHISYGAQQVRAQIKGAYDAGYDEWILWNAAVKYKREILLTDEEAEAERQQWEAEKLEAEKSGTERKADASQSTGTVPETQVENGQPPAATSGEQQGQGTDGQPPAPTGVEQQGQEAGGQPSAATGGEQQEQGTDGQPPAQTGVGQQGQETGGQPSAPTGVEQQGQ